MSERRTLLIFTYYYPPCAAVAVYRMLAFSRYLPEFGWDVAVVAPPQVAHEPHDDALLAKVPANVRVLRVPFPRTLWSRVLGRFYPLETWLGAAWRAGQKFIAEIRPHAVLSSSPPGCVHSLGYRAKRTFNLPWIACLRDPWITNHLRYGRKPLRKFFDIRAEARTMNNADLILANTPLNLDGLRAGFPGAADRMICVTNGFDPSAEPIPVVPPAPKAMVRMLHAGEIYFGRDPRPLLDVLRDLRDRPDLPDLRLEFLGKNTQEDLDLNQEISQRGLESRVSWRAQVPHADAVQAMRDADLLVVLHTPGYKLGVPAKLYEYLGIGKPILVLAEPGGDIDVVLRTAGVTHRVAAPLDGAGIRTALIELAREIGHGTVAPPDPVKVMAYTRREIVRQFAQRLDRLVPPSQA